MKCVCVCACVCVCVCVVRMCRSGVRDRAQTGQTGFIMTGSEPGRGVQLDYEYCISSHLGSIGGRSLR